MLGTEIRPDTLSGNIYDSAGIELIVARFDLLHETISGNKLYKLRYFLEECTATEKMLVTFGGAWSNHLAATAAACRDLQIKCVGYVRGHAEKTISKVLQFCMDAGMELRFTNRNTFDEPEFAQEIERITPEAVVVPAGGFHPLGAAGASLMMKEVQRLNVNYVITATGTATTAAGLLMSKPQNITVVAVPVIKNMTDINDRISGLINKIPGPDLHIADGYSFGGYAKYNNDLLNFMNNFYLEHNVPSDFVYTGKMFYAAHDMAKKRFFPRGSRIVCIHTGGLIGNGGLPAGSLIF